MCVAVVRKRYWTDSDNSIAAVEVYDLDIRGTTGSYDAPARCEARSPLLIRGSAFDICALLLLFNTPVRAQIASLSLESRSLQLYSTQADSDSMYFLSASNPL